MIPSPAWDSFLRDGAGTERVVGNLSAYLNGILMASSRQVRIGQEYAVKAVEKHRLDVAHFEFLPSAIREGEALRDRERHLTFLHYEASISRWFQVTVKCCNEKRHLYVVTFHGLGIDDVRRKRARHPKVWPLT